MKPELEVAARCAGNDECLYGGEEWLVLEVGVTNRGAKDVGFPLAQLQKIGPIVRLVDRRTGRDRYLSRNPPNPGPWEYPPLHPGQTVTLSWEVLAGELKQFGGPHVDLTAEITVLVNVMVDGAPVEFDGSTKLRIVEKRRKG